MIRPIKQLMKRTRGSIRSAVSTEVCPFCFETFKLNATPFRCASPPQLCSPQPDPVLIKRWEDKVLTGRVLPAPGKRFVLFQQCPNCSEKSHKRLCPHCHQELPHTFAEHRNYIIALIGAKTSGKSHYLPVLIEQLKRHVGPRMDMLLQPMNDATISRYRNDFFDPLFNQHKLIEGTFSALQVRANQLPMTFSLTFTGKGLLGGDRIKRSISLAFFDTAGEDLKAEDTMNVVNKYIYRSDGIILLIDPLQLGPVRDRLPASMGLPLVDAETSDIVTRVTTLIRRGRGLDNDAKIPTPLAVALSKVDAVEVLLDPQSPLKAAPSPSTRFDRRDFVAVDGEVRSLIAEWDSEYLLQQVRTHFKRSGFFALTALGGHPDAARNVKNIVPRRVVDPFLWLLAQHGLIKTSR